MKSKVLKIAFCIETIIIVVFIICFLFSVRAENTTELLREISPNGDYVIVINEKGEPDWPFGADHIEVRLFENTGGDGYRISFEAEVHNDGGRAGYKVEWLDDSVQIVLSGEEQPAAYYILPFKTMNDEQS